MKTKRKIIKIDQELCNGCGQCATACAEGAIEIRNNKARVISDRFCDGLGACLGECPMSALTIVEREADDFDEKAVHVHLQAKKAAEQSGPPMACGCPSTPIRSFKVPAGAKPAAGGGQQTESALSHWPVQIRLIPPQAPFLQNADLLVVADCVPIAYPDLHREFLAGKAVMIGCPKFDDAEAYAEKFKEIFRIANIKSVTVLDMEVPCCSALSKIVKKGMQQAQKTVPMEVVTISAQGRILKRQKMAALK
ncbi:MAG: 4Fe-4S ferredoxin [Desulfobacteraceae bacterium]|nr:MAG: 4Fe-4S ferredoxin [Desulfobacteraceae bacterium]